MNITTVSDCRQAQEVVDDQLEHKEIEPADALTLTRIIHSVELQLARMGLVYVDVSK